MIIRRLFAAGALSLGLLAPLAALAQVPGYQPPDSAPAGEPQVLKI